jgi:hypothetical protein
MENLAARPDRASLVEGEGKVRVQRWHPPRIELTVQAETAVKVRVLQFYYPGWVAMADDGSARLEVGPSGPDGLLGVNVPPGTHRILIEREPLPEERAGQLISGVSLATLVGISLWMRSRRRLN